jgi:hypothetical protein
MVESNDQCAIGIRAMQEATIITEAARTAGTRKKSPNTIPIRVADANAQSIAAFLPKVVAQSWWESEVALSPA